MIKRIIRIVILILVPFLVVITNSLLRMPELEPGRLEQVNDLLKDAENRFLENGRFRRRIWLDGESWDFQSQLFNQPLKIVVPSCWNSLPGMENYYGKAIYSLDFLIPNNLGPRTFLCFRGISYQAKASLNSVDLGEHSGAYTPFEFEITDSARRVEQDWKDAEIDKKVFDLGPIPDPNRINRLKIEVDNQLSMKTIPGKYQGWKHIGGIYREVYLEERSEVFIKNVKIIAEPDARGGKLKINLALDNAGQSGEFLVRAELIKKTGTDSLEKTIVLAGEKEIPVELSLEASRVKSWSPEKPRLYPLQLKLLQPGKEGLQLKDQLNYQIGFRKLEARGDQLFLNGKLLRIQGISRQNFYPVFYQTIPPDLIQADLEKIKEMGANLVRLGHYPNHPYLLLLCDQLGLLVWEEIPAWGKFSPDYSDPEVINQARAQLKEMILRDRNHPSLAMIGLANEIPSGQISGENFIKELSGFARPIISGQLLVSASDQFEKDLSAPDLDLIGFNCYFGWYGGKVEQMEERIKKIKPVIKNKPILISEYGADARARKHGASGDIYTEENQALFLQKAFKIIEAEPGISGGIIWLFADYPDPLRAFNPKPFTNQKGLLTEDRKEKLGFKMASSLYQNQKIHFSARSRIETRIRDSTLAGLILLIIFLGISSGIPEKWILLMPGLTHPLKLLRRAVLLIGWQALIYELIWESYLNHQPLALPITFSYPAMKLLQVILNSKLRPIFIFLFLFWLWWLFSEFLSLLVEKRKDQVSRHPFELALGVGDPLATVLPYPMIAFFPALIGLALNIPSLMIYGKFLNQFTTIPWLIFQFSYLLLILISLIKLPLVIRSGFKIGFFRASLFLLLFFFFANSLHALILFFLCLL